MGILSGPVVRFGFFTAMAWVQFAEDQDPTSQCVAVKSKQEKKTVGMVAQFQEYTKIC